MLNLQLGFSVLLYSKKAIAQLKAITPISGNAANQLNSSRIFKCPYHANVMKTFENTSNTIEYTPCETIFLSFFKIGCKDNLSQ